MKENTKKYSLGVVVMVLLLGFVAVLISTTGKKPMQMPEDEILGSAEEQIVDDVGSPPQLMVDPEVSLSGALTPDGNFFRYERDASIPSSSRLTESSPRENWVPIVSDEEYDSILEMLDDNTDATDQLTLIVVWDSRNQEWEVYPNEIFTSNYDISTLDIFSERFDGVVLFNASRSFDYADHVEDRVGDFDVRRGWNYGPKPDFDDIRGQAVTFWSGDVTGNADMLTPRADLGKAVSQTFFDDLDDDEVYWFYVRGAATSDCSNAEAFVCGRDGNTYQNSCKAGEEGVTVDYTGKCKTDRAALLGKIKDDTLDRDETLVLEFFTSATDTTPENIQIESSEIDLDESDEDLAIYRKNGAAREFITSFASADVATGSRDVRVSLNNKLDAGDYELRIFNTFEKEKVTQVTLDFTVEDDRQVVEVNYSIESVTPRTIVLSPDRLVSEVDLNEVASRLGLYNAAGTNQVQGGTVTLSNDKKLTLTFANDVLVVDAPDYKLKLEETTNSGEFWEINAFEKDLKAVKIVSSSTYKNLTNTLEKDTVFRLQNGVDITSAISNETDFLSLYISDSTGSNKLNDAIGEWIGATFRLKHTPISSGATYNVRIDEFTYVDDLGYYIPIQSYEFFTSELA